jgi:TolA-binding protein
MKSTERHHLKQNEFALTARRTVDAVTENRRPILFAILAIVILGGGVFGFLTLRARGANEAGARLGEAMAIAQSPIAPPSTLPGAQQAPGTYPTETARSEAALKAYQAIIADYPSGPTGITAKYEAAGELLDLGRAAEAETYFNDVITSGEELYASMARLGLAQAKMAAGQHDEAIKLLTDLAANRDSSLPIDGVLIQLAQAYTKAGKTQDARAAYQRVVDEFADSVYAFEARQRLAALK